MPKSDHLRFDFFCVSRIRLTKSGPSESLLLRTTTETGEVESRVPAFSASSPRADRSGVRWYADAASVGPANKGGFLSMSAKALCRIGVVERRFFSRTTRLAVGKCC